MNECKYCDNECPDEVEHCDECQDNMTPPACPLFRAGDIVKHGPTGERWWLAVDEEDGDVMPNGWPETLARASDCELVKRSTDKERHELLVAWAEKRIGDLRVRKAQRQLKTVNDQAQQREERASD